ncbi:hypothetical protein AGDE_13004 [Angomonas deanei]|uniref:Protein tyrosine kinase/Protein kinase domain/Kinase-like, putative n=1 Tax=Angomonas deanei TaxID=59799 RepID=A0A7G2CA32_9TRYP|nr:hypothetical protein AGDE_13004 [Angomonas deanei]CAD2216626.1 Protein tyrosine kinase/Protein kinase domain/Kinase-like, putative [Angomonas deanei]|eukprot:EPY23194.1 hypothetical protein AGDE_13004 [Angomonas deanei]
MIGTVENIDYDNGRVLKIVLRFPPGRDSPTGKDELKEIITCERIGQGTFGTVYRALCDGYSRLAVKVSTGKASRLREELEVLSKVCTHGKLLLPRFEFGALNKQADLIVIGMELCVPSTLHDMLLSTKITNEADMLYIGYQCAQTIGYVHEQNCIHRDVKLQNFVFDLNGNVKLIDFGLSCSTLKPPAGDMVAGTMSFMSPEMAHNALYREKRVSVGAPADIWSLGIVLFSIFTQRNPYPQEESSGGDDQDKSNEKLLQRVAAGKWSWPPNCTLSADLRRLVENVLVVDPEKRPSITEVLKYKVWNARRRSSPAVLTAFLGVQDDFFLSHDEEHLLRAVEQRSAGVAANVLKNRHRSTESQSSEDIVVDEELKIEEHGNGVDGAPGVQVYDVRASGRKKSKPIREISQVIEEHVKEKSKSRRGKSNREDRSRAGSTGSEFKAKRVKKKEATPPSDRPS